jgi:hypothetical protein
MGGSSRVVWNRAMNYYNDIDPGAAAWIGELIYDGQIP